MSAAVTQAQLAGLAEQARMFGIDEMQIHHATPDQIEQLRQLPGARYKREPWHSVSEGVWKILTSVHVAVGGVMFFALHTKLATADDLVATMPDPTKLRSVP